MADVTAHPKHPGFLDFDVEVGRGRGRTFPLRVASLAGDLETKLRFPFSARELDVELLRIDNERLLSSRARRVALTDEQRLVQDFGQALFDALLPADARALYDLTRRLAEQEGKGVRLKLRVHTPELAALPWEYLFDSRQASFVNLSSATPLVRDVGLAMPLEPLAVKPPLRILGMVASPSGLEPLDIAHERQRVEKALTTLRAQGLVDLRWLPGQQWRDLKQEIRRSHFHVFHFIGHGGFDPKTDEGLIALADDSGAPYFLPATDLGMLLADEEALRLVVLNSCDGAKGGERDLFSSTASILIRRGIPAVVAMQHEITDDAAIEFAREFYEALADGVPVEAAVTAGRQSMRLAAPGSLEWATPTLYLRAEDGVLFDLHSTARADGVATTTSIAVEGLGRGDVQPPKEIAERHPGGAAAIGDATGAVGQSTEQKPKTWWQRIPPAGKLGGFITTVLLPLLAALNGLDMWPFSAPGPPVLAGELYDARIEYDVTLGEGCESRGWDCRLYNKAEYPTMGHVISVGVRLQGYEDRPGMVVWTMYDARTDEPVPFLQNQEGFPRGKVKAEGADDRITAHIWVPFPMQEGNYYVRLTLVNDLDTELSSLATEQFSGMP